MQHSDFNYFVGKKIFIAGASGMLGQALCDRLKGIECTLLTPSHRDLDLTRQAETEEWVCEHKPDLVFLCAAKVGGIYSNRTYPAEFIYQNLAIAQSVIHASYLGGVKKILFLGSSCTYPKHAPQPIKEEYYLTGALEPTNQAYAAAKIAGIQMAQSYREQYGCDFIVAMPANAYGINDHTDINNCHVIPALLQRFHLAKKDNSPEVSIWGSGEVTREFIYVDDYADACCHLMASYSSGELMNIGSSQEISIKNLAFMIKNVVGYRGEVVFDKNKPDGMPRKVLDSSKLKQTGWRPKVSLETGLTKTYNWMLDSRLVES